MHQTMTLLIECGLMGCEHVAASSDTDKLVTLAQTRHLHINMRHLEPGHPVEIDDFSHACLITVELI